MYVQLIEVPYDSGHWGTRLGRGPGALMAAGAEPRLREAGHAVEAERVGRADRFPTEVATGFAVCAALAERVRAAVWHSRFPLVLAGNCLSAAGIVAGVGEGPLGIVWLDAHADFHTPETTTSGFLDGMALAVTTGRCWGGMAATIPGYHAVDARDVLLVGARDLDPAEPPALAEAGVARVAAGRLGEDLPAALDALRRRVERVYLHLDLDVLDAAEGAANPYAAPGGPSLAETERALEEVHARFRVVAAAVTALDPAIDPSGRAVSAGIRLLEALVPPGR